MSTMYEGQYIVNSFHAVDAQTGEVLTANEAGYITLSAGQTIVFRDPKDEENVDVNTIVFFSAGDALRIQLNDNEMYPFYVEAGGNRGIKNMRIYSFTALEACTLYYEGIVC